MKGTITIKLDDVIIKRYKIRPTGKDGATLETSIPPEAFERESRRQGLTVKEASKKLEAVWRYNNFPGLHVSFELREVKVQEEVSPS